jgi:hypothetical protein
LLKEESLSATHIAVFVHISIYSEIKELSSNYIKTGFGNLMANKGALAVSFVYNRKSFLFINCHLSAGHKASDKRNSDFHRINSSMTIPDKEATPDKTITDEFDICIWLGDFNYRLELEPEEAMSYINDKAFDHLYDYDQLLRETLSRRLEINYFIEGRITFNPTYKFETGQGNASKYDLSERTPGWTDRILYKQKGDSLIQCKYDCIMKTFTSDHKPVYAVFKCEFEKENGGKDKSTDVNGNSSNKNNKSQLCIIY